MTVKAKKQASAASRRAVTGKPARTRQQESKAVTAGRDASGKFIKGFSGNPHGKAPVAAEVRELARSHSVEAIETLVRWMRSNDAPNSIAAARELLARAWGKPEQSINTSGQPLVSITMGNAPISSQDALSAYLAMCRDVGNTGTTLLPAAVQGDQADRLVQGKSCQEPVTE